MNRVSVASPSGGAKAHMLVGIQLLLFLLGATLTILWIGWGILPKTWWGTLPVVGVLLLSLLVFSYQEGHIGIARQRREEKNDPEGMGGVIELFAFLTWLFLLVNMIVAVFRTIRAIRGLF